MAFLKFMNESGVVGWTILLTGIGSLILVAERAKMLYKEYGMNSEEFMGKVQTLVLAKKLDEALLMCAQLEKKPLAAAFKTILEKADRDDDSIFQAHDIALSENIPLYTKRLHYLSMLANVATLLGLLGTIHGLILSFQAVAQADPAQKQALLAQGISVSMYTTALGLAVAIPAMVFFSFLTSRQNELMEEMQEKCSKLAELLTSAHIPNLTRQNVFPDHVTATMTPPAPGAKVS
ncbi:MotA/TolQ/ExbB proton channel family protein [Bdellovibrio svalbardensis]|uniref:MotA/TolQ/ExbB proton channel family protein n=1 Tax=Bdellovibrio svalbardensis TaxID=2972972 RepID=A0ABT6DN67_9BACT|nr:MotA/TolQ/ExbB proton channel family protein [Bdellovibrio svalbardensis]MDG0817550.1 MotA/TolQ/ExbB proton channel family protein [Bdellovibrio svalbardensis]